MTLPVDGLKTSPARVDLEAVKLPPMSIGTVVEGGEEVAVAIKFAPPPASWGLQLNSLYGGSRRFVSRREPAGRQSRKTKCEYLVAKYFPSYWTLGILNMCTNFRRFPAGGRHAFAFQPNRQKPLAILV